MKRLLIISSIFFSLFFLSTTSASAATYYFSTSGSDTNNGTTPETPFQTLSKLETFGPLPGDSILFKRGDTFYGSIEPNRSGTADSPITYGAYGTGNDPIITGFTTVNGWTDLGNNIWESTTAVSTLPTVNMVVVNGVNTPMGRYPNSGYLTFQSHSGQTSITSSSLTGTPNWTGAEAVVRSTQFTLDRSVITAQSGGTLTLSGVTQNPTNGYGFFIQNDPRTLDSQNEWYYNPSTKKIRIYSTNSPTNVQVSSVEILAPAHGSYLTFENLSFTGANSYVFYNDWGPMTNFTVQNSSINFSGIDGLKLSSMPYFKIENSTISNSNNNGIDMWVSNPNATIRNNIIQNSGVLPGMGQSGMYQYSGIAPAYLDTDPGLTIENNSIINTGYIGINFSGSSVLVQNNFVDTFCTVLDDCGGIYVNSQGGEYTGSVITGNIVINGIGASDGTVVNTPNGKSPAEGIYMDGNSSNIEISNNSVANVADQGIFIHDANNFNIHGNTFYNNDIQFGTAYDGSFKAITGNNVHDNIFFSKIASQIVGRFISTSNDIASMGTFDNNYYARPIDDTETFKVSTDFYNTFTNYTLSTWQTFSGLDLNSHVSPKAITDLNDLRFEYNASDTPKTVTLDANYIDVKSTVYPGIITLAPYSSAVLIATPTAPHTSSGSSGSSVSSRYSNLINMGNTQAAEQLKQEFPNQISNNQIPTLPTQTISIITPAPSTPLTLLRILKLVTPRIWGDDVLAIQTLLNTKGYDSGTPDGNFGPKTQAAVIAFQSANGLVPDGSVGPNTLKYLNGNQATTTTTYPAIQPAVTRILKLSTPRMIGDDTLTLQTYLSTNGYDVGTPDGIFGTKTQSAVIAFQTANNLNPDGLVGVKTREMMK